MIKNGSLIPINKIWETCGDFIAGLPEQVFVSKEKVGAQILHYMKPFDRRIETAATFSTQGQKVGSESAMRTCVFAVFQTCKRDKKDKGCRVCNYRCEWHEQQEDGKNYLFRSQSRCIRSVNSKHWTFSGVFATSAPGT